MHVHRNVAKKKVVFDERNAYHTSVKVQYAKKAKPWLAMV
jgi:hypothetical protein